MSVGLLLTLAGLALIDSTSIGTLFIPVWLLLTPGRVRVGRILTYLGTIAGFYLGVGLLLVWGGTRLADTLGGALDHRPVLWAQLALGVGLFVLSFRYDGKRQRRSGVCCAGVTASPPVTPRPAGWSGWRCSPRWPRWRPCCRTSVR